MRRTLHWAFNFAAALSAVLLVAVCVLWVRSHWRFDRWTRNAPNRTESVISMSGRLIDSRATAPGATAGGTSTLSGPPSGFHSVPAEPSSADSIVSNHAAGFAHVHVADPWSTLTTWMVPYWSLATLCAVLPAWRWAASRRRPPAGSCPKCGYDLRATPDRCPECGHVPKQATPAGGVTA